MKSIKTVNVTKPKIISMEGMESNRYGLVRGDDSDIHSEAGATAIKDGHPNLEWRYPASSVSVKPTVPMKNHPDKSEDYPDLDVRYEEG